MPLRDKKYRPDQTILKVLGCGENRKIRLVHCNWLYTAGIEDNLVLSPERGLVNDGKLECNISRTKSKIYELAFCNPWEFFFTATINPDKHDRTDLNSFHRRLTQFFRDFKKANSLEKPIDFLLIPELHKDGRSWHMHGFIMGLPSCFLRRFQMGDTMGKSLAEKVLSGDEVYNWPDYQSRFGYCSLERIRNHEAVSKYITKYINKGLYSSVKDLNAHLYYRSRGLQEAEVIKKGSMSANIEPSYSHEYGWVAEFDYSDELLDRLVQSFF